MGLPAGLPRKQKPRQGTSGTSGRDIKFVVCINIFTSAWSCEVVEMIRLRNQGHLYKGFRAPASSLRAVSLPRGWYAAVLDVGSPGKPAKAPNTDETF